MPYSDDFKNLLAYAPNDYIGFGNPNAKILFLCQETDINGEDATYPGIFEEDIINNARDWQLLTHTHDSPMHMIGNCEKLQKSPSMDVCQRLINAILDLKGENANLYNFYKFSFQTHLCNLMYKAVSSIYDKNYEECKQATQLRVKILSSDFFRNFNIVIAPLGHFPRHFYGDEYFGDVFGVEFQRNEGQNLFEWINVSERQDDKNPILLIHCEHLRKTSVYNDNYIAQIAKIIIGFAKRKRIPLLPATNK